MSELEKEFVPYQESLELKELGFDKHCFGSWETEYGKVPTYTHSISEFYKNSNHPTGKVTVPTFSQAFRWFREKYDFDVTIKKITPSEYKFEIEQLLAKGDTYYFIDFVFKSYKEAELACLRKLIKIAKNKI